MFKKNETHTITDLTKKQERKNRRAKIAKRAKYVGVLAAAAVTSAIVARKTVENAQFEFQVYNQETGEFVGSIKSEHPKK